MTPHPTRLLLLVLTAGALAAGCTGDQPGSPSATAPGGNGADASASASSPSTATPGVPSAPSTPSPSSAPSSALSSPAGTTPTSSPGARQQSAAPVFRADTRVDTEEPTGGRLTVVAARASRQPGYDRVVLTLAGKQAGQPGWRVEYVDEATQDGSGDQVEVAGDVTLAVLVTGVGYPMDTGQEEETDDLRPKDTQVVREVVLGATFEGQYQAWLGLTRKTPFRVFRLSNPARVVIDVRHR